MFYLYFSIFMMFLCSSNFKILHSLARCFAYLTCEELTTLSTTLFSFDPYAYISEFEPLLNNYNFPPLLYIFNKEFIIQQFIYFIIFFAYKHHILIISISVMYFDGTSISFNSPILLSFILSNCLFSLLYPSCISLFYISFSTRFCAISLSFYEICFRNSKACFCNNYFFYFYNFV